MKSKLFIGRTQELELLQALYRKKATSLVVVKGRRRIGKSRLIKEFATRYSQSTLWNFAGVTPLIETSGYFYRVIDITDFLQN